MYTPFLCGNGAGSFTKNREIKRWGCTNRISNGRSVCDSHHINEDVLYATYHAAVQAMVEDAGSIHPQYP
ncbi:MAG: zinc ribbon domain-containing protein [Bacteroides sp.]